MRRGRGKLKGLIIVLFAFLISCGGGSIEGELSSVIVSASAEPNNLTADIKRGIDTNNDGICDISEPVPVQANVRISVIANPSLPTGITSSPVEVLKVRISYSPDNHQVILPSVERILQGIVDINAPLIQPVEVLDVEQARILGINVNRNISLSYYVVMDITVREIFSGRETVVRTGLNLTVGDFLQNENCIPPQ